MLQSASAVSFSHPWLLVFWLLVTTSQGACTSPQNTGRQMHSHVHLSILSKLMGSDTFCTLLLGGNNEQFRMEIGLIRRRLVMCALEYWGKDSQPWRLQGERALLTSLSSKSIPFFPYFPFSYLFHYYQHPPSKSQRNNSLALALIFSQDRKVFPVPTLKRRERQLCFLL